MSRTRLASQVANRLRPYQQAGHGLHEKSEVQRCVWAARNSEKQRHVAFGLQRGWIHGGEEQVIAVEEPSNESAGNGFSSRAAGVSCPLGGAGC